MMTTLADSQGLLETGANIFSQVDTLARPDPLLSQLAQIPGVWAGIFLALGLIVMFYGVKYERFTNITLALAVGAIGGFILGKHVGASIVCAGCAAALLATCCWAFSQYTLVVLSALVGAFLGANVWTGIDAAINTHGQGAHPDAATSAWWVGAGIGLLLCGFLAFKFEKFAQVFFNAVIGSTFAVLATIALLLKTERYHDSVTQNLSDNAVVVPMLVIVPAIISLIIQHAKPGKGGSSAPSSKAAPKAA
jgi:hypothetical protein